MLFLRELREYEECSPNLLRTVLRILKEGIEMSEDRTPPARVNQV